VLGEDAELFLEGAEFAQVGEGLQGVVLVDAGYGEANVDQDVVADLGFGEKVETCFADDSAELDTALGDAVDFRLLEQFTGDG
jgi:hypothetical protein